MQNFYFLIVFSCALRLGFCDSDVNSQYVTKAFDLLNKNNEMGSNTIRVTISEVTILSNDNIVQINDTIDFDLNRGVYKIVSNVKNPAFSIPSLHTVIVGDRLNAYQQLNDKTSDWVQERDLTGVENRIRAILSQVQFTTSPIVKNLSRSFNDYIHMYTNTDQLNKLPQYIDALKGLNSKGGFSVSTDTLQAHCVTDESGLITHLDCETETVGYSHHYDLDIKIAQNSSIEFPPSPVHADETKKLVSNIKKPIFGFAINVINGVPTIVYAFPGSAYVKAGGQTGDKVLKIDDTNLQSMANSDIESLLLSKNHVSITILQGNAVKVLDVQRSIITPE